MHLRAAGFPVATNMSLYRVVATVFALYAGWQLAGSSEVSRRVPSHWLTAHTVHSVHKMIALHYITLQCISHWLMAGAAPL